MRVLLVNVSERALQASKTGQQVLTLSTSISQRVFVSSRTWIAYSFIPLARALETARDAGHWGFCRHALSPGNGKDVFPEMAHQSFKQKRGAGQEQVALPARKLESGCESCQRLWRKIAGQLQVVQELCHVGIPELN